MNGSERKKNLRLLENVVQPYLFCDQNLWRFLVLVSKVDSGSALEQQKNIIRLLKLEIDKSSHSGAVLNRSDALNTAVCFLIAFIPDMLDNRIDNSQLVDGVDADILKLDRMKKCNDPASCLPLSSTNFSAFLLLFASYKFRPSQRDEQQTRTRKKL